MHVNCSIIFFVESWSEHTRPSTKKGGGYRRTLKQWTHTTDTKPGSLKRKKIAKTRWESEVRKLAVFAASVHEPRIACKTDSHDQLQKGESMKENINHCNCLVENKIEEKEPSKSLGNAHLETDVPHVEPWTFKQYLGKAVCIPAGCPRQVRNRQVKKLAVFAASAATTEARNLMSKLKRNFLCSLICCLLHSCWILLSSEKYLIGVDPSLRLCKDILENSHGPPCGVGQHPGQAVVVRGSLGTTGI
ncbi:unnamed protein product [Fraxinus pennsylvanica]|uniref:Uncharacterized protein n=1 Tax=Fraxinus pennsylvanica TaxID=56036 RepID=A0AAD1Z497_9LAMI|nr:unnamed protein product [Fraxinus pennsylvanica]